MKGSVYEIFIYNETCGSSAGQAVEQRKIDDYDGDPREAADWTWFAGTAQEIARWAVHHENIGGAYHCCVAETLGDLLEMSLDSMRWLAAKGGADEAGGGGA